MRFRDLAIGDTFDFIAPSGYNSFFNRCTKVSSRKYQWANPIRCSLSPNEYLDTQVGTINVEVYHVARAVEHDPANQEQAPDVEPLVG